MAEKQYVAWLRWTKSVRKPSETSKKRELVDSVESGDMIYPFSAVDEDDAREQAQDAASTEGSRGGPDSYRILKIWEVVREVPRTKEEADAEAAEVAATAERVAKERNAQRIERFLSTSLRDSLSIRSAYSLENGGIRTPREMIHKTEEELLRVKNFGRPCVKEVNAILAEMGLKLGMSDDEIAKLTHVGE